MKVNQLSSIVMTLKDAHFSSGEWKHLGLHLGLYPNTLNSIDVDHQGESDTCLRECLYKWLQRADGVDDKGGAKWSTLVRALIEINHKASAEYISESMCNKMYVHDIVFYFR